MCHCNRRLLYIPVGRVTPGKRIGVSAIVRARGCPSLGGPAAGQQVVEQGGAEGVKGDHWIL